MTTREKLAAAVAAHLEAARAKDQQRALPSREEMRKLNTLLIAYTIAGVGMIVFGLVRLWVGGW